MSSPKELSIRAVEVLVALLSAKKIQELVVAGISARRARRKAPPRFAYYVSKALRDDGGPLQKPEGIVVGFDTIPKEDWEVDSMVPSTTNEIVVLWRTEIRQR